MEKHVELLKEIIVKHLKNYNFDKIDAEIIDSMNLILYFATIYNKYKLNITFNDGVKFTLYVIKDDQYIIHEINEIYLNEDNRKIKLNSILNFEKRLYLNICYFIDRINKSEEEFNV